MKLLFSLIFLVFSVFYYSNALNPTQSESAGLNANNQRTVPDRCVASLQKYFVEGKQTGIEITYIDPSGKVVYSRGNSMTANLFSPDLSNVDSYAGLTSDNEDCFDGKKQIFSDKKTVEGFYDSRSFRITKSGMVTLNNEGQLRTFPISDCNDVGNVFNGYYGDRLYTFYIAGDKKFELVAQQCNGAPSTSTSTTGQISTTGSSTTGSSTTGNGGSSDVDFSKITYNATIQNTWQENGQTFSYITVNIFNSGSSINNLSFNFDAQPKENSVWGAIKNSNGDYSIGMPLNQNQSYALNLIIKGSQLPTFKTSSIN